MKKLAWIIAVSAALFAEVYFLTRTDRQLDVAKKPTTSGEKPATY
jgi:hypothetical protein